MSAKDKIANKIEELTGTAKKETGKATGNERLEAEGTVEETTGSLKQAAEKVKDAFKH